MSSYLSKIQNKINTGFISLFPLESSNPAQGDLAIMTEHKTWRDRLRALGRKHTAWQADRQWVRRTLLHLHSYNIFFLCVYMACICRDLRPSWITLHLTHWAQSWLNGWQSCPCSCNPLSAFHGLQTGGSPPTASSQVNSGPRSHKYYWTISAALSTHAPN